LRAKLLLGLHQNDEFRQVAYDTPGLTLLIIYFGVYMDRNVPKYSAVFLLFLFILVLRAVDQPFDGWIAEEEKAIATLAFLNDPPATGQLDPKPADRPMYSLRDFSNAMVDIAEMANPTVVTVFTERTLRVRQFDPFADFFGFGRPRQQPREREFSQTGQGSGVIISSDGYIITNAHVIKDADTVNVRTMNNRVYPAKVIGSDPDTDIAVLQIQGSNFPAIPLGSSENLRVGEWIMAIGSPLAENLAHTVTMGIVSAKGRSGIGLLDFEDFIQTDAAINPGNSGGALINLDGELVGINTAIASRSGGFQGIGFAIPIDMAKNIMRSLIEHGKVTRGFVGITIQSLDPAIARAFDLETPEGVLISEVAEDSPASKAGLKEGDIITMADSRKMSNSNQFLGFIASKAPGDRIRFRVIRDGKPIEITVDVGEATREIELARAGSRGLWDRTGFSMADITHERARELGLTGNIRGVLVEEVNEESLAFRNNLRKNDIILSVNRRQVRTVQEFNQLAGSIETDQVILLQILRGRQTSFIAFEMK
jgi:serine protease Do